MSLSSQITKAVYVPDGVQTLYAVPFPLFSERDVECWAVDEAGLVTAISNFTVEGFGTQNGVHVRFATAPAAGGSLVVRRNTRQVQESTYPEGGKFPSLVVENDFDRIVGMVQELNEAVDRSLKVNVSEESTPESAEELYSRIVGIAADAEAAVGFSQSNAASANQSAVNAAASRTAAAQSAAEAEEHMELARRWAEHPEDTPVTEDHYSAYHWAKKALENSSSGVNLSDALDGTRKAGDGVGASEWAVGQAVASAAAADAKADSAGQAAAAAQVTADAALPQADYDAEAWSRARAVAFMHSSGKIMSGNNIVSATYLSAGKYRVIIDPAVIAPDLFVVPLVTAWTSATNDLKLITVGRAAGAAQNVLLVNMGTNASTYASTHFVIAVFQPSIGEQE